MTKKLLKIFGWLVTILALLYIFLRLRGAWPQIQGVQLRWNYVFLAVALNASGYIGWALLWNCMLYQMREPLPWWTALRIWFLALIMRYIPGHVWHLLRLTYEAHQEGCSIHAVSLSLGLEHLQFLATGALVLVFSLSFWPKSDSLVLWSLLLIPLLIFYLFPQLFQRPLAWGLRRIGLGVRPFALQSRALFALVPGYVLTWLLHGAGVYCLVCALEPQPLAMLLPITGMYAVSWIVGFLSFITPGGLGVREGVLGYLLALLVPAPVAFLAALLSRMALISAELLCAAYFAGLSPRISHKAN